MAFHVCEKVYPKDVLRYALGFLKKPRMILMVKSTGHNGLIGSVKWNKKKAFAILAYEKGK